MLVCNTHALTRVLTLAPSFANATAMAAPIPVSFDEPVMIATFPWWTLFEAISAACLYACTRK
jgi:hypothetical protein